MSQSDQNREHRAATIAHLNDRLRLTPGPGWMMTSGLQAMGVAFCRPSSSPPPARTTTSPRAMTPMASATSAHRFGSASGLFWKIDYYDRELRERVAGPGR